LKYKLRYVRCRLRQGKQFLARHQIPQPKVTYFLANRILVRRIPVKRIEMQVIRGQSGVRAGGAKDFAARDHIATDGVLKPLNQ
jgi:hypothetical protein